MPILDPSYEPWQRVLIALGVGVFLAGVIGLAGLSMSKSFAEVARVKEQASETRFQLEDAYTQSMNKDTESVNLEQEP